MSCLSENEILAYVERSAPAATRAAWEEHVAGCDDCCELIAETARAFFPADLEAEIAPPLAEPRPESPQVPGYATTDLLSKGAMGEIYQARQHETGRTVALKFLALDLVGNAEVMERFRREAESASACHHPNICATYELGTHAGQPFIVMELVKGLTMRELGAPMPVAELIPILRQVAEALRAAHAAGVVHRDIKPENIMVQPDGFVKVVDFGLARLTAQHGIRGALGSNQTRPGQLVGTLPYMSPEQLRGEPVDGTSDVFSLGVVGYEAASGRHPFASRTLAGFLQSAQFVMPRPTADINPAIPSGLSTLLQDMLAKTAAARPRIDAIIVTLGG